MEMNSIIIILIALICVRYICICMYAVNAYLQCKYKPTLIKS